MKLLTARKKKCTPATVSSPAIVKSVKASRVVRKPAKTRPALPKIMLRLFRPPVKPVEVASTTKQVAKTSNFSLAHVRKVKKWIIEEFGLAKQTKKRRTVAFASWKKFITAQKLSLVPTGVTLTDYMVHELLRGRKLSGISSYLGGIGATLQDDGVLTLLEWRGLVQSKLVRDLKKSAAVRERAIGIGLQKAEAITLEELEHICERPESYDDLVLMAVCITAFFNLHRGTELVSPGRGQERLKQPYAQDVTVESTGIGYTIRNQKTKTYQVTKLFLVEDDVPKWAMELWKKFWAARTENGWKDHADLFVLSSGRVVLANQLNAFLSRGRKLSSHSLRSGGATYLMQKGMTMAQIMQRGRWTTMQSLLGYLRDNPRLGKLMHTVATVGGICTQPELAEFE